jgi:hypothetical protein
VTLSATHYIVVNVPYVYLLPEYSPQPEISLPSEDGPRFLVCCVLYENLPQFDFKEFPYHSRAMNALMILNGPTSINPVDLNQVSVKAR